MSGIIIQNKKSAMKKNNAHWSLIKHLFTGRLCFGRHVSEAMPPLSIDKKNSESLKLDLVVQVYRICYCIGLRDSLGIPKRG